MRKGEVDNYKGYSINYGVKGRRKEAEKKATTK
jgi:hypothetical protein